ncbi:MAG TPA: serine/threonine-protein kinase, partial [Polyangiales bacterium]|nr:serine/threonine-protein kinase [Polyangiales bacterium]
MKRELEPTRALERSLALVCRELFREPSELLAVGRFELVRTLGSGGMGVVYEALDAERGERVALKMLKRDGASDQLRLKREFRALAQLRHPNLVALHELNVNEEHTYFTMELVHGSDILSYVLRAAQNGAVDADLLRRLMTELSRGVLALHQAGKLHRDLKPSNVLVSETGHVVLLDFGLVRDAFEPSVPVEGTPLYMAPERYRGRACEASDWYSVGRILAQLLTAATRQDRALE